MLKRILVLVSLIAGIFCQPTLLGANDSSAEFGIGGLVLAQSSQIEMVSEDLYISDSKISVEYVFRNVTDQDVRTLVAFPIPELAWPYDDLHSLPYYDRGANFVGFETFVDGAAVETKVELRALTVGVDRTDLLKKHRIPLIHYTGAAAAKLKTLSNDVLSDLKAKGLITTLNGAEPAWTLKTTFYWQQDFPKGKDVKIAHKYTPVSGGAAFSVLAEEPELVRADYRKKYCLDSSIETAVQELQSQIKKQRDANET